MILPEDEKTVQIMGCLEVPMPEFVGCRGGMGDVAPLTNRWLRCLFARRADQARDEFCWGNALVEYHGDFYEGECILSPEEEACILAEEHANAEVVNQAATAFRHTIVEEISRRWPNNERIQNALKILSQKLLQCK